MLLSLWFKFETRSACYVYDDCIVLTLKIIRLLSNSFQLASLYLRLRQ